jgi:hypothetical protein
MRRKKKKMGSIGGAEKRWKRGKRGHIRRQA